MSIQRPSLVKILGKRWLAVAIILVTTFLVYSATLKYDFVYDDEVLIVKNRLIRDWRNIPSILFSPFMEISDVNISFYRRILLIEMACLRRAGAGLSGSEMRI